MKMKLSALTLALLPCLSTAAVNMNNDAEVSKVNNDSVIVVFKKEATKAQRLATRQLVNAKIADVNKDELDDNYKNILNGRLAKFKLNGANAKDTLKVLNAHPAVKYAEPDHQVTIQGTPDDARFDELWGLHNTGQTGGTNDADIDAVEAWDISVGSRDVIVAVIDTGVDHAHPDLTQNMWINPNEIPNDGIDNDNNGYIDDVHGINAITDSGDPMDDQGHGTHVAGTIGALGNDGNGVVGVNHQVSIIGCKFLSASGSGVASDAIKCVDYLVGLKNAGVDVRISNNSWGGGGYSQAMADALTSSEEAGILFVAAAGNSAVDNDTSPHYPSSYELDSVLAVASTTHTDSMSSFSQWGLTSVDIGAPGSAILSTVPGGGYSSFSGTSMASPHVAGAAALALSVDPSLSTTELKALLMETGDANADLDGKVVSGKRLNIANALEQIAYPSFKLTADTTSQLIVAGETATFEFSVSPIQDWSGDISLSLTTDFVGASLSADTVSQNGTFTVTVPTTADTSWGSYDFTIDAISGDIAKQIQVSVTINPQGLNDFSYDNTNSVDIPDNDDAGITSVITINDDITIFGSSTYLDITHTYIGDLVATLTSPSGTTATLHNKSGGGTDDIKQSFASDAFNGEVARGDWVLNVVDTLDDDTGTLNQWSLTLTGLGEVSPSAPEANFSYVAELLSVNFTDQSTDVNNDIASWAWDFGDTNSSSEQNPTHNYAAAGTYQVSLTVTDEEGLTDTHTFEVTVADANIELSVKRATKTRRNYARIELAYSGAVTQTVDVYRDGVKIDNASSTGIYRDFIRRATQSQYVYKVCSSDTICSEEVTVTFE